MEEIRLRAVGLKKLYRRGPQVIRAVDGVDIEFGRGECSALVGASGSGKSTILNLLAGLDTPTEGRVEVDGVPLASLSGREIAAYRARRVGMVFQSFHLVPHRTALQNVELALYFDGTPRGRRREKAAEILYQLGLGERLDHRPADLSGGEQQRVALARALVIDPEFLFADEPSGNLDRENTGMIAEILEDCGRRDLTVVLVTHDLEFAGRCADRVHHLRYGRVSDAPSGREAGE